MVTQGLCLTTLAPISTRLHHSVVSNFAVYVSGNIVIKRRTERPRIRAAMRADELLDAGDLDGERVWLRIVKAVEELLAKRPGPGKEVH